MKVGTRGGKCPSLVGENLPRAIALYPGIVFLAVFDMGI